MNPHPEEGGLHVSLTMTCAVVVLTWLAVTAGSQVKHWPKPALVLEGHEKSVDCVAISPDGKPVAKFDAKTNSTVSSGRL